MSMNKVLREQLYMTEQGFRECGGREWVYKNIAHKMVEAMAPGDLQKLFCITETWGRGEEPRKKLRDPLTSREEREKLQYLGVNNFVEFKSEIEFTSVVHLPLKRLKL